MRKDPSIPITRSRKIRTFCWGGVCRVLPSSFLNTTITTTTTTYNSALACRVSTAAKHAAPSYQYQAKAKTNALV
ncbi:hypothetical protein M8J77_000362 [Diaphorina citri]|nr:hypothetical protein M8J77_000362 [Diaphorina citri]